VGAVKAGGRRERETTKELGANKLGECGNGHETRQIKVGRGRVIESEKKEKDTQHYSNVKRSEQKSVR